MQTMQTTIRAGLIHAAFALFAALVPASATHAQAQGEASEHCTGFLLCETFAGNEDGSAILGRENSNGIRATFRHNRCGRRSRTA